MAFMRHFTFVWLLSTVFAVILARDVVKKKSIPPTESEVTLASASQSLKSPTHKCRQLWCNIRLPNSIVPYHYNLYIKVNVNRLVYEGYQLGFIHVKEPTDTILVHTKEMKVPNVAIKSLDGQVYNVSRHFSYPDNEYHVTIFENILPVGHYILKIEFTSKISETLTGFYRSSYMENGIERVLLTTKFQPTDARKAFPCFDEPDMKATFNITITHPKEYSAHSNMPGVTTPMKSTQWSTTVFSQTVRMSTYLVAFIVSKFECKYQGTTGVNDNVNIAIWSRPDYTKLTEYAFNASTRMLTYIEGLLNVKYTMPKLDMFAIPDYGSGATEHWGIITYRESRLLYQAGVSSSNSQKNIAAIIAHEITHLWFGNLVTCKWWNDLWVQEGMASYLEYYLLDDVHPEWNIMDKYVIQEVTRGMKLDAQVSSHPLSQPLKHPNQIKAIFDIITYRKGASLFGMLDNFLGKEIFLKGLHIYLNQYKYEGATVSNLWDAFSKVSQIDIKHMMNTWTQQMGFPVVTIKKIKENMFSVSQKHFLVDPSAQVKEASKYNYQWIIPLTYVTNENLQNVKVMVLKDKMDKIISSADWLIGNYKHKGFYRVNYDERGWEHIITQMNTNHEVFSITDRVGILDDAFSLARSGTISYSIPFRLMNFLQKEGSHIVWNIFLNNFSFLNTVLSSHDNYGEFRAKYASILKDKVKTIGTSRIIMAACRTGEKDTIASVQKSFKQWMENGTLIPGNVRRAYYICAVANGGDEEWEYVHAKYTTATNPAEKNNLLVALSASQKPWIINKWLRYSIDPSKVRSQDMVYVVRRVAIFNQVGQFLAWEFAENNWTTMMGIAKENNFHVNVLISGLTGRFTTQNALRKVIKLWEKYPDAGSGKKARDQGTEHIKTNIGWLKRNADEVSRLLQQNV